MKLSRKITSIITDLLLLCAAAGSLVWAFFGNSENAASYLSNPAFLLDYTILSPLISLLVAVATLFPIILAKKERAPRWVSGLKLAALLFSFASAALFIVSAAPDSMEQPLLIKTAISAGVVLLGIIDFLLLPKKRKCVFVDALWAFPLVLLYGAFLASFCFLDVKSIALYNYCLDSTSIAYCYKAFGQFGADVKWYWVIAVVIAAVVAYFLGVVLSLTAKRTAKEKPDAVTSEAEETTSDSAPEGPQAAPAKATVVTVDSTPQTTSYQYTPVKKLKIKRANPDNRLPCRFVDDDGFYAKTIVVETGKKILSSPRPSSYSKVGDFVIPNFNAYCISRAADSDQWEVIVLSRDSHDEHSLDANFATLREAIDYAKENVLRYGGQIVFVG